MNEPTEEMILAGIAAANRTTWKAMQAARAASPKVPQGVEEWIAENGLQFVDTMGGFAVNLNRSKTCQYPYPEYVSVDDLRALLSGMAIVPVDALNSIMELAGVAIVYQPFGTKDWQHFDALLAAAKEKNDE